VKYLLGVMQTLVVVACFCWFVLAAGWMLL
jgi:hypothetical protein